MERRSSTRSGAKSNFDQVGSRLTLSESHLCQFVLKRELEFLHVRRGGLVALLSRNHSEATGLIEIPIRLLAIAERNLAADQRAGTRKLVHRHRDTSRGLRGGDGRQSGWRRCRRGCIRRKRTGW